MLFSSVPFPGISTPRLLLREPHYSDIDDVYAFCSNPQLCRYSDWYPHRDKGQTRDYIAWLKKKSRRFATEGYTWFAVYKPENRVIATVSVVALDYSGKIATIGYTLSAAYQGRGLATEAVRGLLQYLFFTFKAQRAQAYVMPENKASVRLLERVGMRRDALLKRGAHCKENCVDVYLYSVTQEDWVNCNK